MRGRLKETKPQASTQPTNKLLRLDRVASLVAESPQWNFITGQNPPNQEKLL